MPKVDDGGNNKKRKNNKKRGKKRDIELWTCLLVYLIKHLVSLND